MKIFALQGSPRREGNTQTVLDVVLTAARHAGADTETIQLCELNDLAGCRECRACQQVTGEPGCVVDDDMQPVLDKALKADVVVWATPVFCWSPAWPLKMALDRFFCMFKFTGGDDYQCLLEGGKVAAVITAGGGAEDGADLVTEIFRRLARFSKAQWLGAFVASHVETPDTIRGDADLIERATTFGHRLAS